MATKKNPAAKKRYTSSITGRRVSKQFAADNPDTTYSTKPKKKAK